MVPMFWIRWSVWI